MSLSCHIKICHALHKIGNFRHEEDDKSTFSDLVMHNARKVGLKDVMHDFSMMTL